MIIIREAKKSDVKTIAGFQMSMAKETENLKLNNIQVSEGVKAVLNDQSRGKFFIAEVDNQVAGTLMTTYEWSDWRNGYMLWIQSVYVIPEYRKLGVYKALYHYIQRIVAEKETYIGIRLYVDKNNLHARRVYEKMGMNGEHYVLYEWMK